MSVVQIGMVKCIVWKMITSSAHSLINLKWNAIVDIFTCMNTIITNVTCVEDALFVAREWYGGEDCGCGATADRDALCLGVYKFFHTVQTLTSHLEVFCWKHFLLAFPSPTKPCIVGDDCVTPSSNTKSSAKGHRLTPYHRVVLNSWILVYIFMGGCI